MTARLTFLGWALVLLSGVRAQSPIATHGIVSAAVVMEGELSVTWVAGWEALHGIVVSMDGREFEPGLLHAFEWAPDCPADLNGDGVITTSDLLLVLSGFGAQASGPPDFNGDGWVASADLLSFLSVFGGDCPP